VSGKPRPIQRRAAAAAADLPESLHPVLRRVLAGRRVASAAELDYGLANLLPGDSLGGTREAAGLLADLIARDGKLVIVSDYDVDGATSTALAIRALRAMGMKNVEFLVPDRFIHGYGLSPDVAEMTLALEPDVVMTVDNGISSMEGVALLRGRGIDVLITDHHLPGAELPDASVIVNPNAPGDAFPSKNLAGVGVVFYMLAALRAELRERGWFDQQDIAAPNLAAFLDLVALGTVADVVPLDYNNRILTAYGLSLIRSGRCAAGITALFQVARRSQAGLVAADLGFAIAPRLNAAGRLTDMRLGIECLICDDPDRALTMAGKLDELNRERREIQDAMHEQALADIERLNLSGRDNLPLGVCLFKDDWHQGVVGIVASRIKDRLQRPVIAFAPDEEDGLIKGSARSVQGLHIKDVLDRIATENPGLIRKYGGHAMAAGLTLERSHYETFSRLYDEEVKRHVEASGLADHLLTDGELEAADFSLQTAQILQKAGPWGQGFPEPLFDGEFTVLDTRVVGQKHLKLDLALDDGRKVNAIAFNQADTPGVADGRAVHAVYRLDVNEFRGTRSLQLVIEELIARDRETGS